MSGHCTDRGGRGCPCAWHQRRKVYCSKYARRKRGAQLEAKRMSARTCPRKFGRFGVCGAVLESATLNGRLVVTCPACERFARGICRDCPRPVDGEARKARRCAACKAKACRAATRKYIECNRDRVNRRARRSYQENEAVRQHRIEYKRAYRLANPEKVKAYKRQESLRQNKRRLARQRAYRAARREHYRELARAYERGTLPLRTCLAGCGRVVTHRKKKCTRCKEAARLAAQQALAATQRKEAA